MRFPSSERSASLPPGTSTASRPGTSEAACESWYMISRNAFIPSVIHDLNNKIQTIRIRDLTVLYVLCSFNSEYMA